MDDNTMKTNTLDSIMDAVHELKEDFEALSERVDATLDDIRRSVLVVEMIREAYVAQGLAIEALRTECFRRSSRCPVSFVTPSPTPIPGSNGGDP